MSARSPLFDDASIDSRSRFHFVYEFLGLPYQDVALLPPSEEGSSKQGSKL